MLQGDDKVIVNFKKLIPGAIIPTFGHDDDSNTGIDFYSPIDAFVLSGESINIDTGIAWEPDNGGADYNSVYGQYVYLWKPAMIIKGRSGLSVKYGIECCNAGVIDSSYRGSIIIRLYNMSGVPYTITKGDRIAQGIVILIPNIEVKEVSELSETSRGNKGLGSSGK
jgi:dUTP pyrophosphatase